MNEVKSKHASVIQSRRRLDVELIKVLYPIFRLLKEKWTLVTRAKSVPAKMDESETRNRNNTWIFLFLYAF